MRRLSISLVGSGFKADAVGSDKSVAFRLPCDPALDVRYLAMVLR